MTLTNPGTRVVMKTIFPVAALDGAVSFYRSLGFEVEPFEGGGYAWVTHRGAEILHLAEVSNLDRDTNRAAAYVHVQDVADWHDAWSAAGIAVDPVVDQPWGMREFSLRDPSGNLLRVGQNL